MGKNPTVNGHSSNGVELGGCAKCKGDTERDTLCSLDVTPAERVLKKEDDHSDSKLDVKKFENDTDGIGVKVEKFWHSEKEALSLLESTSTKPRDKDRATVGEQIKQKLSKKSSKIKQKLRSDETVQNRRCLLCPTLTGTVPRMNNHVLYHFKTHLLSSQPKDKPYTCTDCGFNAMENTLLRHYAFAHKHIFKYCNEYVLRGQPVTTD